MFEQSSRGPAGDRKLSHLRVHWGCPRSCFGCGMGPRDPYFQVPRCGLRPTLTKSHPQSLRLKSHLGAPGPTSRGPSGARSSVRQPKRQFENHWSKPRPEPGTAAPSRAPAREMCWGCPATSKNLSCCLQGANVQAQKRNSATCSRLGYRWSTQALFSNNSSIYEYELYNGGDAVFSTESESKQLR